MNSIIIFFISYFLTFLGFVLGITTKEEHDEIKSMSRKILFVGVVLFYIGLAGIAFFFQKYILLGFIFLMFFLYLLSRIKYDLLSDTHDVVFFALTFMFLTKIGGDYVFLILLPMFLLIYENSFRNFNLKDELYKSVILIACFLIFNFFL